MARFIAGLACGLGFCLATLAFYFLISSLPGSGWDAPRVHAIEVQRASGFAGNRKEPARAFPAASPAPELLAPPRLSKPAGMALPNPGSLRGEPPLVQLAITSPGPGGESGDYLQAAVPMVHDSPVGLIWSPARLAWPEGSAPGQ